MRNLIIKLCYWIIKRLEDSQWKSVKMVDDGTFEAVDKKGKKKFSRTGYVWTSLLCLIFTICFVGCSTHKHCGTAHYSEMNSQDFQNIKQNMQTEHYLINSRELR